MPAPKRVGELLDLVEAEPMARARSRGTIFRMIVYAVVDDSLSITSPLGDAIETFVRAHRVNFVPAR